jgi:hypothetical protein
MVPMVWHPPKPTCFFFPFTVLFIYFVFTTDVWMLDFFAPWCHHCKVFFFQRCVLTALRLMLVKQVLAPEYSTAARQTRAIKKLKFGKIDCQQHQAFCAQKQIRFEGSL